jgi:hypothetical protein
MTKPDTHRLQPDPREDRLPAWAQNLIRDLRRTAAETIRSAQEARLATDPDGSLVQIGAYRDETPIGLGDQTITFRSSKNAAWDQAVQVRPHRGGIEIRGIGVEGLRVEPNSINAIRVWQGDK